MKIKINDKEFYMDGFLVKNLDIAKKVIKKDWDMVFIVDGKEGCGKSDLAQKCAFYCDPTLTIDRVCFSAKEFKNAINKAQKYEAVIFDEAYSSLSSRGAMSEVNRILVGLLAEIRQKNLFVFIVLPCFFELDKYAGVWRSIALIHVYSRDQFERGYFSFYNQQKKKTLYMHGKKFYEYNIAPNFRGRFTKGYIINEEIYRAKKLLSLTHKDKDTKSNFMDQRDGLIYLLHDVLGLSSREISEKLQKFVTFTVDMRNVGTIVRKKRKELEEKKEENDNIVDMVTYKQPVE